MNTDKQLSIAVLRSRAKALAKLPASQTKIEDGLELVEFLVAGDKYAVDSLSVREVYALRELTPLPCAPTFILGIVNVRGQILAVLDIRRLLDLTATGLTNASRIIVVEDNGSEVGLLADEILGVSRIQPDDLQSTLPTLTGIRGEYLKGVTDARVVVLDLSKIMADIVVNDEAET